MTDRASREDGVRYELVADADGGSPSESPLRWLGRVLRGRYRLAGTLAALLAIIGAVCGWFAVPPKYEATALLHIEGALPTILHATEESKVPPNFDAFVSAQESHLGSRRILEAAVNSPEMTQAGWPTAERGIAELQRSLVARRRRGEHLIGLSVTHRDPAMAHAAVNAVLGAFEDEYTDPGGLSLSAKEATLVRREQALEQELVRLRDQILDASDQYGRNAIDRAHTATVDDLMAVDDELARVRGATDGRVTEAGTEHHAEIAALRQQELALLAEISTSRYRSGHPVIRDLVRLLQGVRARIDLIERGANAPRAVEGASRSHQEAQLLERLRRLHAEGERLGRQLVVLDDLTTQEAAVKDRLSKTRQRLDEIRFEASRTADKRINIARGGLPVVPSSDRRAGLSAAGALFGTLGGIGIVLLIGLVDTRLRYAAELEALDLPAPLIALLPDLATGGAIGRQHARQGVRKLRHMLELGPAGSRGKVFAVTGAEGGEGVTNVTLALGASFAAAGRRTLVVDADFSGPRLTAELGLGGRPGLCEAVSGSGHEPSVHETRQANLWALPIGATARPDADPLGRHALDGLLDALGPRFDVIIIDGGPLRANAESSLVCAAADGSVLVVARYRKRGPVRKAVAHFGQVGAELLGLVYNKAGAADITPRQGPTAEATGSRDDDAARAGEDLGPIARLGATDDQERKRAA